MDPKQKQTTSSALTGSTTIRVSTWSRRSVASEWVCDCVCERESPWIIGVAVRLYLSLCVCVYAGIFPVHVYDLNTFDCWSDKHTLCPIANAASYIGDKICLINIYQSQRKHPRRALQIKQKVKVNLMLQPVLRSTSWIDVLYWYFPFAQKPRFPFERAHSSPRILVDHTFTDAVLLDDSVLVFSLSVYSCVCVLCACVSVPIGFCGLCMAVEHNSWCSST